MLTFLPRTVSGPTLRSTGLAMDNLSSPVSSRLDPILYSVSSRFLKTHPRWIQYYIMTLFTFSYPAECNMVPFSFAFMLTGALLRKHTRSTFMAPSTGITSQMTRWEPTVLNDHYFIIYFSRTWAQSFSVWNKKTSMEETNFGELIEMINIARIANAVHCHCHNAIKRTQSY